MNDSVSLYRITFKYLPNNDDDSWKVERIMVASPDLFLVLDCLIVNYPEVLSEGNYIKIEEVVF